MAALHEVWDRAKVPDLHLRHTESRISVSEVVTPPNGRRVQVRNQKVRGVFGGLESRQDAVSESNAIRARGRDPALMGIVVRHLANGLADDSLWHEIDTAGAELEAVEKSTLELARGYRKIEIAKPALQPCRSIAFLDVTPTGGRRVRYDKTMLLLAGQERASIALLLDGDTLTFAAPFDSGLNFLDLLGLSGGMPTLVSVQKDRLDDALAKLGVPLSEIDALR